jgi:hypothetical protein
MGAAIQSSANGIKGKSRIMKNWVAAIFTVPLALAFGEGKKVSLFTAIDFGRLESGFEFYKKDYDPSGLTLNRTYVDVGLQEQLNERILLSIGVGGIFWKGFEGDGGGPAEKVIKFGPGISNAYMKMNLSEGMDLTFGYFPYKYNESAKNLGEYLFRTEAYPTIIYTGGWGWMNSAGYNTVGAMYTWNIGDGKFKQDVGLFGEYFNSPIYDITPAYIATWKPGNWLTAGGAVSLHRYITPTPQTRKEINKSFSYYADFFLPGVDTTGGRTARPTQTTGVLAADATGKSALETGNDSTYLKLPENAGKVPQSVTFDLKAVKALAFFNLNLNGLFGLEEETMGRFNLYGEVAQLGFKNYPIFYTDMAQRRPIMIGFSVPTFGLLNNLSFEVEYLKNPTIESLRSTYDKLELPPDEDFRYLTFTKDDYKWTLHASRKLNNFLTLFVQVANDHMRLQDGYARPEYIPITNEMKHWYWLTRIQWAI